MFGRHLELKLVKNSEKSPFVDVSPSMTPEEIERIAKKVFKYVIIGAASTMAFATLLNTTSEIAVNRFSNPKNEN